MRARGPMHDDVNDIRSVVSNAMPLSSIGGWRTALVPNGVRVSFDRKADCQSATRAMREYGFRLSVLEPTGRRDEVVTVVVTGWDGPFLRRTIDRLQAELHESRSRRVSVAAEQRARPSAHDDAEPSPSLRSSYAADRRQDA